MAKNSLSEMIKTIQDDEDGDQAYGRLFGHQMRPCTFRRVFTAIQSGQGTTEVDAETAAKIKVYVDEKMNVDEAFKSHCPEFIGPGEFSVAFDKEKKARKSVPAPSTVKSSAAKKPASVTEEKLPA